MRYSIAFKDLPFKPEERQVIYVENLYDERINGIIRDNYERIKWNFKQANLDFVYLPMFFNDEEIKEKVLYYAPYLTSEIMEKVELRSSYLLGYMRHIENKDKIKPSFLFAPCQDEDGWKFQGITIDIDDIDPEDIEDLSNSIQENVSPGVVAGLGIALLAVFLLIFAIGLAFSAFLLNPLKVGLQKFFLDNANDPKTGLNKNNIGLAFSGNYMKVVGSMFSTEIFTFLWSILFIIPGIYKAYCWRMVPYIVSENPTISGKEARAISTKMMDGNKWAAFVLDISFFGWIFLGVLTLNILNLVFTNPYIYATDAELYLTLSGRPTSFDGQTEPVVQFGADDPEVYADPVVEVDPVVQVDHAAPTELYPSTFRRSLRRCRSISF